MRYVPLGGSDLVVSQLGLGCGNFGGIGSAPELFGKGDTESAAYTLLDAAVDRGVTLLDTANSYGGGRSELWIGRWLRARPGVREELVITTKVGNPVGPRPQDRGLSPAHVRDQVEASLRRLGTDRIDLYLTHAPDPDTPLEQTLAAFDGLVRAGKIRYFGLSNVDGAQVDAAVAIAERDGLHRPVNLQIGHSLLEPADQSTLDTCVQSSVAVTAYSPLAGGWLTGKYESGPPYPHGSRMALRPEPYDSIDRVSATTVLAVLRAHARRSGVSVPQLAMAWVLSDPAVTAVIAGSRTPVQLELAIDAVDHPLEEIDRADIDRLALRDGR